LGPWSLTAKAKRITNSAGVITSTVEVDPFGGETNRSVSSAFQPRKFTNYTRDSDLSDDAMHRSYSFTLSRFQQPDPYDGSYSLTDPQSFNRYSYVQKRSSRRTPNVGDASINDLDLAIKLLRSLESSPDESHAWQHRESQKTFAGYPTVKHGQAHSGFGRCAP
jgi:hypothetical protein